MSNKGEWKTIDGLRTWVPEPRTTKAAPPPPPPPPAPVPESEAEAEPTDAAWARQVALTRLSLERRTDAMNARDAADPRIYVLANVSNDLSAILVAEGVRLRALDSGDDVCHHNASRRGTTIVLRASRWPWLRQVLAEHGARVLEGPVSPIS